MDLELQLWQTLNTCIDVQRYEIAYLFKLFRQSASQYVVFAVFKVGKVPLS
jgi:hypothetical protein